MKLTLRITRVETHRVLVPFVALFHHDAHGVGGYAAGPTFIMHYHHLTDDVIKWTPEKHAENERLRKQLIEEHGVIPKDRWARDPANYPYY